MTASRINLAAESVGKFLRETHGVYRTAYLAADATGIGHYTIRKWLEGKSTPSMLHFLALVEAYGPAFLIAVIDDPQSWLRHAALERAQSEVRASSIADRSRIEAGFDELQASLARGADRLETWARGSDR